MALIIEDRVLETSTSTGTGDFTLSGAITGFRSFSSVCTTGDTVYYTIEAINSSGVLTGDWETGLGTYSAANTLTRTTVDRSSNANAAVSFSAGSKRVAMSLTAAQLTVVGGWTEAKWWDFAVDGASTSIECDVTGAKEILIIGNDLTNSSSVQRVVQVSIDGGTNWYTTSGDYDELATTGVVTSNAGMFPHSTAASAARTVMVHIYNNGFGRTPFALLQPRSVAARFRGSTTAVNHVRVTGLSGGTGTPTGSMNGGTIQFLVR